MVNAVLYARYSSDMQREESIDAQLRAGREYCKKKNYNVLHEYFDEAVSGKTDNRPQYQQMLLDAKRRIFDVIVFHKIDRNARNEYDYYYHKAQLQKVGVRFEYAAQQIDDSPEGNLMENMLVGFAAYYSRNLAKEVMKGLMENALKGLFCGGTPPLGFDIKNKNYVINEHEAEAVRLIYTMYIKGFGYSKIVSALNDAGYKTKSGKTFGKNSLYDILHNRRYVGDYIFNKVNVKSDGTRNSHSVSENVLVIPDIIPKIIEREVFEEVQLKLIANKRRSGAFAAKHSYLLSGLLECGECGSAMIGRATTTREKKYYYYKCGNRDRKCQTCDCHNPPVPADELEDIILSRLEENIFSAKGADLLANKIANAFKERSLAANEDKERLVKQYEELKKQMDKLYSIIENDQEDEFDLERLKEVKNKTREVKKQLTDRLVQTDQTLSPKQVKYVISSYREMLKAKQDEQEIKLLLNTLIDKIIIDRQNITIRCKIDLGGVLGAVPSAPVNTSLCIIAEAFCFAVKCISDIIFYILNIGAKICHCML